MQLYNLYKSHPTPSSPFRVLGALVVVILLSFLAARAYDFEITNADGVVLYFTVTADRQVEVAYPGTYSTSATTDILQVPATVTHDGADYSVTGIGEKAFLNSGIGMSEIKLPESITYISNLAFARNDYLTKITIPKNVSQLGTMIFDACFSLTEIKVANGNRHFFAYDNTVFSADGSRLVLFPQSFEGKFTVPSSVTEIAPSAFFGCSYLHKVTLPQSLQKIGDNAFYFCNALQSINIPASVNHIGSGAFACCASLEAINVDESSPYFASVDGMLFDYDCTHLIQTPAAICGSAPEMPSVTDIADYAFSQSWLMSDVAIPFGTTSIGESCFNGCYNLETSVIPSSVTSIGSYAMVSTERLQSLYIGAKHPDDITLGDFAFTFVNPQAILYVPTGSANAYRNAPQWSDFNSIVEYDALAEQQIIWDPANDVMSADSTSVTLSAVASSQLPVEYMLSPLSEGIARINGNVAHFIKEGEITIIARQPGNHQFLPARTVSRSFTIPKIMGITDVAAARPVINTAPGRITIVSAEQGAPVSVFDIYGRAIYNGVFRDTTDINVRPHNIYIVMVGAFATKLAIR